MTRDPDHEADDALADDLESVRDSRRVELVKTYELIEALGWERPQLMSREPGQTQDDLTDLTRLTFLAEPATASARAAGSVQISVLLTAEAIEDFDSGVLELMPDIADAVLQTVRVL